jgi:CheY-like chemotaxis protein
MESQEAPLVAVVNTSEELADVLASVLEDEGFRTTIAYIVDFKRGRRDLAAFLAEHDPQVLLWDLAIPYEENWAYLQGVLRSPPALGRQVILTTTNKAALERLVGPTEALEVIGRPFDLDELVAAVRRATGRDP